MTDVFTICLVAFLGSALTLFSGFGLGTLLLPAFGLFFPIEIAVAMTAIVHFLNNLFKLWLLGRHADRNIVLRFGIPSVAAAFIGAWLLVELSNLQPLHTYTLSGRTFMITPVKLIIGILMIGFAILEFLPSKIQVDRKYLPAGGLISGFFGGLSGHQGALRSAFLIRAGLSKESFVATGVVIACMVDVSRLTIYAFKMLNSSNPSDSFDPYDPYDQLDYRLLIAATLAAFVGAYIGNRLLRKATSTIVQRIVATMLFLFALLLLAGII